MRITCLMIVLSFFANSICFCQDTTYAERLGYPKGSKVVILHVDDVGMSYDSNKGAIDAMENGVANSCSVMMPCPWVPQFMHYLKQHPLTDAGLHLTLTSEWKEYRWGPLAGKPAVPGLTDQEGALWASVEEVITHATATEVEKEVRAQIDRARAVGFAPTHLDSHMGTLFATPAFLEKYLQLGMEYKIPVMFPGGHASLIAKQMNFPPDRMEFFRTLGKQIWNAGLPVLDDLCNETYSWKIPDSASANDGALLNFKRQKYLEVLRALKPGVTMIIMHCTAPTEVFSYISDSGPVRKGDLMVMKDPIFRQALQQQGIILTTWRELGTRRALLSRAGK